MDKKIRHTHLARPWTQRAGHGMGKACGSRAGSSGPGRSLEVGYDAEQPKALDIGPR